ncbi:MAG: chromate transporter [Clostridiales bacterium]|jgi:chromate transporter|nr:chromate transporter [Clostridiales bacterium]OPZ70109.1 MAG: putative chromate transport protein [Firmicutes bacterium ADurb.Bin467]
MTLLLTLCWEFLLTGLFAVGGGLATLPFLSQMGAQYMWFTQETLVNMVAVSESTPGPIGINMATYVGYTVAGVPGSVLATFSVVLLPLTITLVIARALARYRQSPLVNSTFSVLRPAVTGLIAAAAFGVIRLVLLPGDGNEIAWVNLAVLAGIFVLTQIKPTKKLHPTLFIALGAVLGMLLKLK